jgi:hypothetical protein
MRISLSATERWHEGVWDTEAFAHGSMSVVDRFDELSQDLVTWAVFWGPQGGEPDQP